MAGIEFQGQVRNSSDVREKAQVTWVWGRWPGGLRPTPHPPPRDISFQKMVRIRLQHSPGKRSDLDCWLSNCLVRIKSQKDIPQPARIHRVISHKVFTTSLFNVSCRQRTDEEGGRQEKRQMHMDLT